MLTKCLHAYKRFQKRALKSPFLQFNSEKHTIGRTLGTTSRFLFTWIPTFLYSKSYLTKNYSDNFHRKHIKYITNFNLYFKLKVNSKNCKNDANSDTRFHIYNIYIWYYIHIYENVCIVIATVLYVCVHKFLVKSWKPCF